jgi:hypothetical protein
VLGDRGLLGDQGTEAVQQVEQEGELLVAVAGRQPGRRVQEVVEEPEGLVGSLTCVRPLRRRSGGRLLLDPAAA